MWISKKPIKFAHLYKSVNQSTLNKAHVIETTKACTVRFMKARNSLVVQWREREKKGENVFFEALPNRFWLTSKSCSWFNKVVNLISKIDFMER